MCCSNNSSRLNEENCDHDDVWISDLNEHRFLWLNYFSILTLVCLTNREKFTRQCRRLLWVMVVFMVTWLKLKVFQRGARKQHKHAYSFFEVPWCWITFKLNLRKAKLLLPIMPIGIVAYAFTLPWDNLCRNSCISDTWDSVWPDFQTPRTLSKMLRHGSYFQLYSRCLENVVKHSFLCLI